MSAETGEPFWTREVKLIDGPPGKLMILGAKTDGKFVPSSVLLPDRPATVEPTVSFPLSANLVPSLTFGSFGVEERVKITREGEALRIHCGKGRRPAGALLSLAGFHFPRGLNGTMTIQGKATGAFGVSITENGKEAAAFVSLASAGSSEFTTRVPSNLWASLNSPAELVITCPETASDLSLGMIAIVPEARQAKGPTGTWIWDVGKWLGRGDQLIAELGHMNIGEVFLQVQIAKGRIVDRKALVRLIEELAAAGIRVNTVEGDGTMASPEGRAVAVERARLLAGLKAELGGQLLSFQYDIEPYVLPEFESDPAFWWTGWGTTMVELAAAVREPVSAVVPFWLLKHPAAEEALVRARRSVSSVVVMSYRTEAPEVEAIAEAWLDWGRRNGVPIAFALENGFVPTEYQHTYLRAETGELVLEVSGHTGRVLLFAEPVLGTSKRLAYSFDNESKIASERISFLSDHEKLRKVRARLQANLSAWDSFNGLLVHEIVRQ